MGDPAPPVTPRKRGLHEFACSSQAHSSPQRRRTSLSAPAGCSQAFASPAAPTSGAQSSEAQSARVGVRSALLRKLQSHRGSRSSSPARQPPAARALHNTSGTPQSASGSDCAPQIPEAAKDTARGRQRSKSGPPAPRWEEPRVRDGSPNPRESTWEPPVSPFGLLEEQLYHDPWKVFLACLLLCRTNANQVRKIWASLMEVVPDARVASQASVDELEALLHPLGFFRFRARAIVAMSADYLQLDWRRPSELRHIGKYASDAYFLFCRGMWQEVQPDDKDLKRYHAWLVAHNAQSSALERDVLL